MSQGQALEGKWLGAPSHLATWQEELLLSKSTAHAGVTATLTQKPSLPWYLSSQSKRDIQEEGELAASYQHSQQSLAPGESQTGHLARTHSVPISTASIAQHLQREVMPFVSAVHFQHPSGKCSLSYILGMLFLHLPQQDRSPAPYLKQQQRTYRAALSLAPAFNSSCQGLRDVSSQRRHLEHV